MANCYQINGNAYNLVDVGLLPGLPQTATKIVLKCRLLRNIILVKFSKKSEFFSSLSLSTGAISYLLNLFPHDDVI